MKIKIFLSIALFCFVTCSYGAEKRDSSEVTVSTVVKAVHDNAYSLALLHNFILSVYCSWTNPLDSLQIKAIYQTIIDKKMQESDAPAMVALAMLMSCGQLVAVGLLTGLEGWCIKRFCKKILNKNNNSLYNQTKSEQTA